MRSDLVHSANQRLNNRFLLCRMTSVAAKRIRGSNEAFPVSINHALRRIAMLQQAAEENGSASGKPVPGDTPEVRTPQDETR
jgi:hypothetical protein